jgi:hypothetical protein
VHRIAVTTLLAHGGVAGAIVEVSALLAIVGLAFAVWLRERKTQERK